MDLKIKVCGMRDPDNLRELCRLRPDFVGFIFYPGSPRYLGENVEEELFSIPGKDIKRVGVFVNAAPEEIMHYHQSKLLDLFQLHGNESAGYCRELRQEGVALIKALQPALLEKKGLLESYAMLDYILVDNPTPDHGGSGKKFSWSRLLDYAFPAPLILSGGIAPGDAEAIRKFHHPDLAAIDLNSRFELSAGLKNIALLREFMHEIRS